MTLCGKRWRVAVAPELTGLFPPDVFRTYADFAGVRGTVLQAKRRTDVILFSRPEPRPGAASGEARLVLKLYRNPHLSGILTRGKPSVSEREYRSLVRCRALGVPAVEPVAFGAERTAAGTVRSSFIITRLLEDSVDLRRWVREHPDAVRAGHPRARMILQELGVHVRRLHENRFFLRSPTLRNILVHGAEEERPRLAFVDIPDAGFVRDEARARKAQARDLGAIFGPLLRETGVEIFEPFLETYLPVGLAPDGAELRGRILHAARVHNNQTPGAAFRRRLHKAWMVLARRFDAS